MHAVLCVLWIMRMRIRQYIFGRGAVMLLQGDILNIKLTDCRCLLLAAITGGVCACSLTGLLPAVMSCLEMPNWKRYPCEDLTG